METIKLDLIPGKKMPSLHASQYDDGRDYHIDLTENRVPYVLDGTETISLTVRKCDNTLVTMDIANVFGGKSYIEFRTTEQMNACAGFNYGEITIEKNGTQISSLNFYLQVEGAPDEGGITSQSEINNLNRQITEEVDRIAPDVVREVAPDIVEDVAPAIVERLASAEVNEIAPAIVEALVPTVIGDNYPTKTEMNTALASKANSSDLTSLASEVDDIDEAVDVVTVRSANLYNPANTLETSYIKTDGTIAYNANYSVTEEYTVPNGKKIILSALLTSAVPPARVNANACRKACIYKSDGTIEMLSSESTAYQYTNSTGSPVKVRYQLWGVGASRSATDVYIVVVDPDVVVPASTYSPYGIGIAPEIIQTNPQTLTENQKSQARANIGATKTLGFDNEDFFREFSAVPNITIATDPYTNEKVATFTGTGSSVSWVRIKVPVLQSKAYVLEFWGKTTDEAYYENASQNGMVVCEFYDKNETKIGNQKYNAYVLGKNKLGYHKYGFVSPWGASYALIRVVTRGTTVIQISNISFTQIERVMPRQDNGIIYFGHQGMIYSAPKNTLPSFELGIVAGFNSNIINPNVTSDGVLVSLHSDPIDSVSDGSGNVYDYTYEQLQAYDFGSWYHSSYKGTKLAKFEDVVKLLAISGQRIGVSFHGISFNTHMTTAKVKEACNIIKKYSCKKPLIKSFALLDLTDAYTVFGEDATYVYCLEGSNLSTKIDNFHGSSLTGELICELPSSDTTDALIAQAKGYGMGVSVYFGNEPTRMKELIKMGVNMFTVDTFSDVIVPMD